MLLQSGGEGTRKGGCFEHLRVLLLLPEGFTEESFELSVGGNNGDFRRKWVFGRCFNLLIPLIETVPEE